MLRGVPVLRIASQKCHPGTNSDADLGTKYYVLVLEMVGFRYRMKTHPDKNEAISTRGIAKCGFSSMWFALFPDSIYGLVQPTNIACAAANWNANIFTKRSRSKDRHLKTRQPGTSLHSLIYVSAAIGSQA